MTPRIRLMIKLCKAGRMTRKELMNSLVDPDLNLLIELCTSFNLFIEGEPNEEKCLALLLDE